jgi:hypothetical protein
MRWKTYDALAARWDEQEEKLENLLAPALARLERIG